MLFTSLAFMGLAALAVAAPHPDVPISERGLTWEPRGLAPRGGRGDRNNNNKDIVIVDTTFIKIDEKSRGKEQELIIFIKEKTIIKDNKDKFKDNIRKNHYKSKNRNVVSFSSSEMPLAVTYVLQNTVIVIVTVVVDNRDSNNSNKRYMQRQLRANNNDKRGGNNDVIIMITEIVAVTINGNEGGRGGRGGNPTGVKKANIATAASASIPIVTISPNAPYSPTNLTMVLPFGASPPSLAGVPTEDDPARILEEDQLLFVEEAS